MADKAPVSDKAKEDAPVEKAKAASAAATVDPAGPPVDPPVTDAKAQEMPEIVHFQVDRDTTVVAEVLHTHPDGRKDLKAATSQQHFIPPVSSGVGSMGDKIFSRVRPGSRFEEGTFFAIEEFPVVPAVA